MNIVHICTYIFKAYLKMWVSSNFREQSLNNHCHAVFHTNNFYGAHFLNFFFNYHGQNLTKFYFAFKNSQFAAFLRALFLLFPHPE